MEFSRTSEKNSAPEADALVENRVVGPENFDPPKKIAAEGKPSLTKEQAARLARAKELAKKMGFELITGDRLPKTEFIPTGFAELDAIIKGFPRRRVTEIYGPASVGKTTLMLSTIAQMDPSLSVLYVDLENAVDAEWLRSFGLDTTRVNLVNPLVLEDAAEYVLASLEYDLIVFDSVASALFRTEDAGSLGDHNIGVKAKLMTQFMRKLIGPLARTKTAMVFINQEKQTIGDMYGPKWYTPGGKALEYAASMRLRLTSNKADRITVKGTKVGKRVTAEITKNKVGAPDRTASFTVYYEPQSEDAESFTLESL